MKVYEGDDELNLRNYISGEFIDPETGEWLENFSPATGKIIALVPKSGQNDINMAVESAIQALPSWSALTNVDRANWLDKIADKLETKYEEIAELESKDTGKPISLAREVDAYRSVKNFRFFANIIRNLNEESYEMEDATNRVIYKPVGVGALITPWNLPLYLLSWKVAPAIGMGNTVVCKPSEMTPLTADLLMKTIDEIGLPKGVVNLVHGDGMGAGSPLVSHENISLVSFTGGTSTGSIVAKAAASSFKKLSLELGGKNASIIFDDCNLENTVKGVVRSGFLNQGQVCLCGSRILVQEKIYDDFVKKFVSEVQNMKIGDPSDENTKLGALISPEHLSKVEEYIKIAKDEGGTVLTGGYPNLPKEFKNGNWISPTVIADLDVNSRCSTEEIFGPVVTIHKFSNEKEAIEIANNTRYGLAGSIWTNDIEKANRVAESIHTGMIWINTWLHRDLRVPFGGVKDSGVGREGGKWSLSFFSEAMNICVKHK
ncbi:MAG: 2-hydroxymuconic semialdehyde dehydrogenase [Euryarchaeota archaeon]|jgi:aminomuconate-semialdehyde/2-hydroxymuconate-6-semialdehyde dehydrogenase|nr:2-hydroxymuconic semialdehyde dehydrogenase [Euryarchaeota archaeon]